MYIVVIGLIIALASCMVFISFSILDYIIIQRKAKEKALSEEKKRKQRERINFIETYSPRYLYIRDINKNFVFNYDIEEVFYINYECKTLQQLKLMDREISFYNLIDERPALIDKIVNALVIAAENAELWDAYSNELTNVPDYLYVADQAWFADEIRTCKKALLEEPVCHIRLVIEVSYTSPAGRNRYSENFFYEDNEILDLIVEDYERKKCLEIQKAQAMIERSKMTDSLRYDVMRRDDFKCVLCGLDARDGAVLEVDHIVPVSKGGKTVMSNLRTLCRRCNRGKRDKIE